MFGIGQAAAFIFNSTRVHDGFQIAIKFGIHMYKGTLVCNLCELHMGGSEMLKVEFTLGIVQRGETPKVADKRVLKVRHEKLLYLFWIWASDGIPDSGIHLILEFRA